MSIRYFAPEEAVLELKRRRADSALGTRIAEHFRLPEIFGDGIPRIVLARQIASARIEDLQFLDLAVRLGLRPMWLEYTKDRFTNWKNHYWRGYIDYGIGRNGGPRLQSFRVSSLGGSWNGKPLSSLQLECGLSLVEFHHRLQEKVLNGHAVYDRVDSSAWFNQTGERASQFYYAYFGMFLQHAILCEDFESPDEEERRFRDTVARPATERIRKDFGIDPLVVHLDLPIERMAWYPAAVRPHLTELLGWREGQKFRP
jgi:hypothetical protein